MTIRVERWTSYEEADKLKESIGGLGGWFKEQHTWEDMLDAVGLQAAPYAIALRDAIIKIGIIEGGDWHQEDDKGCPVFSDGSAATFSYRAWGDFLAAAWQWHTKKPHHYMDFYTTDYSKVQQEYQAKLPEAGI